PKLGALGQASPKDAHRCHVATRVIDLVFCPLNVIELILLSENEYYKRSLQNFSRTLCEVYLTLIVAISSICVFAGLCVLARERPSNRILAKTLRSANTRNFHLPQTIPYRRSLNFDIEKLANYLDVRRRVTRQRPRRKTPSASHCHRNQQLIRQILSDRRLRSQVAPRLLRSFFRNGFCPNTALAKTREYFGHVLAFDLNRHNVAGATRVLNRFSPGPFTPPRQFLCDDLQLTLGDVDRKIRHDRLGSPGSQLSTSQKIQSLQLTSRLDYHADPSAA